MVLDLTKLPKGAMMLRFLQKARRGTATWHSTTLARGCNGAAVADGISELPGMTCSSVLASDAIQWDWLEATR